METYLLYKDTTADGKISYPFTKDMIKDLNLDIIFWTMAKKDEFILEKVRKIMLIPLLTVEDIIYRQEIISDMYRCEGLLTQLYAIADAQQKALRTYRNEMNNTKRSSKKTSEMLSTYNYLKQGQEALISIRRLLNEKQDSLKAEGLHSLIKRLQAMNMEAIYEKLKELENLVSGCETGYTLTFGGGLKLERAVLNYCRPEDEDNKQGGLESLYMKFIKKNMLSISNDMDLKQDITVLNEAAMQYVMQIFKPYLEKMMNFFKHFSEEIAFYMGVVNFMNRMKEMNNTLNMPTPQPPGVKDTEFAILYELSMAIYVQHEPVGNTLSMKNNRMSIITGANQGGKSTFLRSYGIAQVLMQCGMPVPAYRFAAPIYTQIFTHFTRSEDEQLNDGRLSEELKRMSGMVDVTKRGSLFLLNESFASTTEKEGSKIAEGLLRAFYEKDITTMMVTHLFQLAKKLYDEQPEGCHFLVAERMEDGRRTYKMLAGEPGYTSFGTDLFKILEE